MYTRFIIGNTVHRLAEISSTNSYAKTFLKNNSVAEGTVIIAEAQPQGRGQYGNKWISEAGKNLTFSIVLFPKFLKATEQFLLSQAISLGIVAYLKNKTTEPVHIKWPNDILIGNKKVCGMLIENALQQTFIAESIAGIGLNINQTCFPDELQHAASLKTVTGQTYDLDKALHELLNALDKYYLLLMQGRYNLLREQYLQNLYRKNERHLFMLNDKMMQGTIQGVNLSGQLQILIDDTLHTFNNKEIEFVY